MPDNPSDLPFWERIPLAEMTPAQWESLCDGCGRCCLTKFEDDENGRMHYSNVACFLLDHDTCRCRDYANRATLVPDCITLTMRELAIPTWLPETCAYRRLAEGRPLPPWHPLRSGDPRSVERAGISVRGRVRCERETEDALMHLIDWVR